MKRKRRAFVPPIPERNKRAARALWEACSRRQRAQLRRSAMFTVRGSAGGCYEIAFRPKDAWYSWGRVSVTRIPKRKCEWGRTRYMWQPPLADQALAIKLLLEAAETRFQKITGCNSLSVLYNS